MRIIRDILTLVTMRISKTMKTNQFYAAILALLAFSTQPTFGMMSPTRAYNVLNRDAIIEQLDKDDAAVEAAAQNICIVALQKNLQGRISFSIPRYERHLDRNSQIPWQALFMANAKMIATIENQSQLSYHQGILLANIPHAQFKHIQRGAIYCETARELLKRKEANDPANANIASLKKMAADEYIKAYKYEPAKLRNALHVAQHRWNECFCNELYTPSLDRNN